MGVIYPIDHEIKFFKLPNSFSKNLLEKEKLYFFRKILNDKYQIHLQIV